MLPTSLLSSAALESVAAGVVIGIALVIVVVGVMKLLTPVNAATRALVWIFALLALALTHVIYLAAHLPDAAPIETQAPTAHSLMPSLAAHPAKVTQPSFAVLPRQTNQIEIPTPRNLPPLVFALYLIIVSALLMRLLVSYARLRFLRARTQPAPPELTDRLEQWLIRCPTNRQVELRLSSQARSPLAIGWFKPVIVIPAALILELSLQDLDHLGVHELAHLRRYDDWTNLMQRVLQAFLFFNPAVYYIGRKLNFEREVACDDWVISANESKSYARCLTKVVELRRYQRSALLLSSGAFFGKRQIVRRIENLLDKTRNSATRISALTIAASLVLLAAFALQVSHFPSVIAFTEDQNDATSMRWKDDSRDLRIKSRGEITFSPDERSITSLSPGGFLLIEELKGWSNRRLEIRPGGNGAPKEAYFLDEHQKPMDGVGRAWAAGAYLMLFRDGGFDADARLNRILAAHGVGGVLSEVELIHSDNVKRQYLSRLMEQTTLSNSDLQRVADSAKKISSDNEKADFLLGHWREFATADLRTSYFRAVNSINSDDDRRRVLTGLLQNDGGSPETVRLVSLSAQTMNSDNDKAEVLVALPAAASGDNHCAMLNTTRTINSDNDKARVLRDFSYVESVECRAAFFAVVNSMQADNDRSSILRKLLEQPNLGLETYRETANAAKGINSDNEKADVLVDLSSHYTESPLFEAANTIEASNDRARLLKAVLEKVPSRIVLLAVIESATNLSADNEKADILTAIATSKNVDNEVRATLQRACAKIGSDSDYRRVTSALFENQKPRS